MPAKVIIVGADQGRLEKIGASLAEHGLSYAVHTMALTCMDDILKGRASYVLLYHQPNSFDALHILRMLRMVNVPIPIGVLMDGPDRTVEQEVKELGASPMELSEINGCWQRISDIIDRGHDVIGRWPPVQDRNIWDIVEKTEDWTWRTDSYDRIIYSHFSDQVDLKNDQKQVAGRHLWDLVPDFRSKDVRNLFEDARSRGAPSLNNEINLISNRGKVLTFDTQIIPLYTAEGGYNGMVGVGRNITQKMEALKESETTKELSRRILDNMVDPIIVTDMNGEVMAVNRSFLSWLAIEDPEDIIGRDVREVVLKDHIDFIDKDLKDIGNGARDPISLKFDLPRADGTTMNVLLTRSVVEDELGRPSLIIVTLKDLTETEELMRQLRLNKQRYRHLIEGIPDTLWEVDRDLCFTYISQNSKRFGRFGEEVLGRSPFELMDIEQRARLSAELEQDLSEHRPLENVIIRIKNVKGEERVYEVRAYPFFDQNGVFEGYRGINRDVTDLKKAEAELARTSIWTNTILNKLGETVWLLDEEKRFLYVSPGLQSRIGIRPSMDLETALTLVLDQHSADLMRETINDMMSPGHLADPAYNETRRITVRARRKDRSFFFSEQDITVLREADGKGMGLIGVGHDVTDRIAEIEELKDTTRQFDMFVDNIPDAVMILEIGPVMKVIRGNKKAVQELGYSQEELAGMPVNHIVMGFSHEQMQGFGEQLKAGETVVVHGTHRRKDGSFYDVETHHSLIRWKGKRVVLSIIRDLSERNDREEQLRQRTLEVNLLNQYISATNECHDIDELLRTSMQIIADLCDFDAAGLFVINNEGGVDLVDSIGIPEESMGALQTTLLPSAGIMRPIEEMRPHYVSRAAELSIYAREWGVDSYIILPLRKGVERYGAMVFISVRREEITWADKQVLTAIWKDMLQRFELIALKGK